MMKVETVRIRDGESFRTINKADFQPGVHEEYQGPPPGSLSSRKEEKPGGEAKPASPGSPGSGDKKR